MVFRCAAPRFLEETGGVQPPIISWKLGLGRPGDSTAGGYFSDRDVGSLSTARMLLMSLAESFGGTTTFSSARTRRFQAGYGR
jgi:hypothetical protein